MVAIARVSGKLIIARSNPSSIPPRGQLPLLSTELRCFMFSLTSEPAKCTQPSTVKTHRLKVKGRTPTVLFIDDDPTFCKCCRRRFRRTGVRCIDAQTGVDGYRLALDIVPDVIVTDLAMPFGAGEDLVAALHENSPTWSIPIVVITGLWDD